MYRFSSAFVFIMFLAILLPRQLHAGNGKKVMVAEIHEEIDPRVTRKTGLILDEAKKAGVDVLIIDLDTYGGAVADADKIRTMLLEFEIPIYVYINKNAASAGALISIACDSIYMEPGANIGAATVVTGQGEAAPDKYQSYMRSMMRSTAEASGRNPKIAEAMVDQNIALDSLAPAGKVITFTTSEAIKNGFCEAEVNSVKDILKRTGYADAEVINYESPAVENVIALFLNPAISSVLILIIIGGIYFELQTPGVGFPIVASIIAAVLYFVPYYLTGLAENWELLMFIAGVLLLAVEVFVLPGFGVAGVAGLVCVLTALVFMMLNNDFFDFTYVPEGNLFAAIIATAVGVGGALAVMVVGGTAMLNSRFFKRVSLQETMDRESGYTSSFIKSDYTGKAGTARTPLRPGGKVEIEGNVYDAVTAGEYIAAGSAVHVVGMSGVTLRVKEQV